MRKARAWAWMGRVVVFLASLSASLIGWIWLVKAPLPVVGLWFSLMVSYGALLFHLFVSLLAPAAGRERGRLCWAFARFLVGGLKALSAVDAGQPRNPSEPREGPGLWLLDARSAMAIEWEGRISRIEGPGLVWVGAEERVAAFVDLRPRSFPPGNSETVPVRTQDGIPLEIEMRTVVSFRPQTIPPDLRGHSPYFFPRSMRWAIAQALRAAQVEAEESHVRHAFALPLQRVREELQLRLGNMLFDELFLFAQPPDPNNHPPLARLAREIQEDITPRLWEMGVRIDRLRIALGKIPEAAWRQRVETWRSQWAARLARWIGEAESEMLVEYARARHAAQMEMLRAISELLAADPKVPPEAILLHFLETLDTTVRPSGLTLPEELQRLWRYLRGEEPDQP